MSFFSPMVRLEAFHDAFDVPRYVEQNVTEREQTLQLRRALIREEFLEALAELDNALEGAGDMVALAKELADLLVVVYGTAEVLEVPLDDVFDAVMDSNMSKCDPDTGRPVRRADGKILKGSGYQPAEPAIAALLGL